MKKRNAAMAAALTLSMVCGLAGCGGGSGNQTETTAAATTTAAAETTTAAAETTAAAGNAETTAAAESSGGETNLVVAWWGNQVRNDLTQEVLDMYADANPGITFDSQPAQYSDYFTKLATAAAGNALPDVLQTNYTATLSQYVESGLLEDLNPYVESGLLDVSTIDEGILESGSVDGGLYAICCGLNVPALIYNKTLTDSLGIEIKDQMTVEEFENISREIYEKSGVKTDLAYGNATSMMEYIMRGAGVSNMFDEKAFSVTDENAFVPFFEIYETGLKEGWMLDAGVYAELTVNSVEQAPLVYFSSPSTQSWCACFWSNQLAAMENAAPEGMELEYATWPAADPVAANYLHPSMYFSVSAGSANKEEAVKVLNYLINDIDCNNVLLGERGIPAPSAVAEAIAPQLPEASQREVAFINDVVTPNSSPVTPVPPVASTEVYALADQLVEKVLYGEMTAAEASAELYNQGNAILAD